MVDFTKKAWFGGNPQGNQRDKTVRSLEFMGKS
jgi:hypothetical protein